MSEVRLLQGDAAEVLAGLPAASVSCVVTSPPYYRLRDYGCEGQIGLEATPAEFIARLVEAFRHAHRVLVDAGSAWVLIGDSYAGSWGAQSRRTTPAAISRNSINNHPKQASHIGTIRQAGLKPKDLIGIPWMLAFALRDAGWFLRAEIIISKLNPLPESVQDRVSRSHEHLFHFTKNRHYFHDEEAISEPVVPDSLRTSKNVARGESKNGAAGIWHSGPSMPSHSERIGTSSARRNARSVWETIVGHCSEAHYAVAPSEVVARCILAGTSARGHCPRCGAGWRRIVEKRRSLAGNSAKACRTLEQINGSGKWQMELDGNRNLKSGPVVATQTIGWQPGCKCGLEPVPAIVLDPFLGSGTTALVALGHGRHAIGIDLSGDYVALARRRLGLFAEQEVPR